LIYLPNNTWKTADSDFFMLRFFQRAWVALAVAGAVNSASAFSMLGPFEGYQVYALGFNIPQNADIGGPMNLGDEYRWNLKTITFGFDSSFTTYFGQRGIDEVRKAIAILNNLPPMSKVSSNLTEFPTNTRMVNNQASALGLLDLKSIALGTLLEEIGLASPERYVWCLRFIIPPTPTYNVIKRNFDPVTLQPSSYVNDTLYTYAILDPVPGFVPAFADAVELPVDPLAFQFTAVASAIDDLFLGAFISVPGQFYVGLTRDDVGGLRYIYSGKKAFVNNNIEGLLPDILTNGVSGGPAWSPVGSGGFVGNALRPGIDKITFREAKYDSMIGFFLAVTNIYKDTYVTNSRAVKQTFQRALVQPDIIFGAADLGAGIVARTTTAAWINNNALNSQIANAGPGIITPPVFITFGKAGPLFVNAPPTALDEQTAGRNFLWGSFDGTTNIFIYPNAMSIQEVEQQVLGGGN
jgi:hypothetical protein